jgi:hypothetical protein
MSHPRNGNAKSPHYNWTEDPKGYKVNGNIPKGRCFHCASYYANWYQGSAFCNRCYFEMTLDNSEPIRGLWSKIEKMYRISDEDKEKEEREEKMLPKFTEANKL